MNLKRCADGSEWSEHKKSMNAIQFECKKHDVIRALNYFKKTNHSKMTAAQAENP